jgi:hypothetical protein
LTGAIAANFNASWNCPSPEAEKIHKENDSKQACQLAAMSALITGMVSDFKHLHQPGMRIESLTMLRVMRCPMFGLAMNNHSIFGPDCHH